MISDVLRARLVRASRRRTLLRLRIAGMGVCVGTIGYVGEREILLVDPKTLRPSRVFVGAIESVEDAS